MRAVMQANVEGDEVCREKLILGKEPIRFYMDLRSYAVPMAPPLDMMTGAQAYFLAMGMRQDRYVSQPDPILSCGANYLRTGFILSEAAEGRLAAKLAVAEVVLVDSEEVVDSLAGAYGPEDEKGRGGVSMSRRVEARQTYNLLASRPQVSSRRAVMDGPVPQPLRDRLSIGATRELLDGKLTQFSDLIRIVLTSRCVQQLWYPAQERLLLRVPRSALRFRGLTLAASATLRESGGQRAVDVFTESAYGSEEARDIVLELYSGDFMREVSTLALLLHPNWEHGSLAAEMQDWLRMLGSTTPVQVGGLQRALESVIRGQKGAYYTLAAYARKVAGSTKRAAGQGLLFNLKEGETTSIGELLENACNAKIKVWRAHYAA